ncbi:type II secretion system protein [Patescibacteria group bacterium]
MNFKKTKAFTLVELIVVITILSILGTIAVISMQNYSSYSRDSVRKADISDIDKSLELAFINLGEYPEPTDSTAITYS